MLFRQIKKDSRAFSRPCTCASFASVSLRQAEAPPFARHNTQHRRRSSVFCLYKIKSSQGEEARRERKKKKRGHPNETRRLVPLCLLIGQVFERVLPFIIPRKLTLAATERVRRHVSVKRARERSVNKALWERAGRGIDHSLNRSRSR